ncbi:MAG: CAP domain-containing protein [Akkermansiaceae bacterium]|nr:CAP domain-containing protein [Akkermansiaceae bacterium]
MDPRLVLAAKDHSDSMATHRYFAHKGLDGCHFQARMARHGYPLSHSAENLAMARDARTVFQMWWDSKGHRTNMMNKRYTRVGIARSGDYWTANYSAPDGS